MFGFHKEPEFHPVDQAGATALGWTSIGIGLAEIAAPRQVESMLGIGDGQNTGILRVLGVREICHGIDLLSHEDPAPGLLSRIAGDMLDGLLLAAAATRTRNPASFAATTAMVLGVVAADFIFGARMSRDRG